MLEDHINRAVKETCFKAKENCDFTTSCSLKSDKYKYCDPVMIWINDRKSKINDFIVMQQYERANRQFHTDNELKDILKDF